MKPKLRILSLLLSLLLLVSLCSCDLSFLSGLSGLTGGDGKGDTDFTPLPITEVVASSFDSCYGDQLSPNERALYDAAVALETGETEFTATFPEPLTVCKNRAPTKEEQDGAKERMTFWLSNAMLAVWLDAPSLFWIDFGDYSYSCTFKQNEEGIVGVSELTVTVSPRISKDDAVTRKAALDTFLSSYTPYGASDADRVRSINRYLCDTVTYDLNAADRATAAGALVDGRCVCEGYAHALQLLCEAAGIDCVCILGEASSNGETEGHMWNAVRIDGIWYYVDATWNDTTGHPTKYLLVGGSTMGFEGTFDETHFPQSTLGKSKVFALPAVSDTAR